MTFPIAVERLSPAVDDAEEILRLDRVSVRYRLSRNRFMTLKEAVVGRRGLETREHRALDAIDLVVRRGETVGIVGANGAGKSTLLRVVARILHPTEGRVRTRGRIAPLLDLFGAFHPELTGRENVALQGALLGFGARELAARFDDIATFAAIGSFLDQPLRTYSAGMMVRLGFALLSALEGDLYLIDEVLGVGDAEFQEKCAARIDAMRRRGASFLIASHDLVRLRGMCDRALWLDHGVIRADGKPADVIAAYVASIHA